MTLHNYRSRQVHETSNGVNPSSGFRDMRSAKSGPNLSQIWQFFGLWASPYGANGQMTMTVHNYRPRQFHRTSNGENPSSSYRDMGSASLAAARPPARTVTTIPLQPGGLRGKNWTRIKKQNKEKYYGQHRKKGQQPGKAELWKSCLKLGKVFSYTWNVLRKQHISQIRKDEIIQTSLVVTLITLKVQPQRWRWLLSKK